MIDVQIDSPTTHFVQEAERRRIARELHDGAIQSLTALVADLEYFRSRRFVAEGETSQEMTARLESWRELARDSLLSMRSTLGDLRKEGTECRLRSALQSLVQELREQDYKVTYECDDVVSLLSFEATSNLYYIIREAITNIRKHAQATQVTLFVLLDEDVLHVSVGDNGVGMECTASCYAQAMQSGYQQGLIGMRERVALLGGHLSIQSAQDKGTRIDINVPFSSAYR